MAIPRIDPRIILPIITRVFPEFKTVQLVKGDIITVAGIDPLNEAEEARALNRKFQRQKRDDRKKDTSFVITLDEAIKCVEEAGGKGGLVAQVIRDCALVLLKGGYGKGDNTTEKLLNPIIDCLRKKTLKQSAVRKRITYRYSKRAI